MAAINFQAPAALFILAVIMYTGRLNHTLPQDKVIDFGLNTTFAAKDSPGIGFEAIVRKEILCNGRNSETGVCSLSACNRKF